MKRGLFIIMAITTVILAGMALVLVVGYMAITHVNAATSTTALADLPLNTWTRIDLSDKAVCSDGSDFRIYVRREASDNLLIHFAGGGMAWDTRSASQPITVSNTKGFYFPNIWEIIRATVAGIFDHNNPKNPFADWNEVYIPYCTGDFHIGDTTITYPLDNGQSVTIYHNGHQNVSEALDWVYANFKTPPKLLVSGESAGAFGSTFWITTIADHYPKSDVYHLSDGGYLQTPAWATIVNSTWKADTQARYGFTPTDNLIASAYLRSGSTAAPHITYLQFNTLYDGVLTYFASVLNDQPDDAAFIQSWSEGLRTSTKQLADSDLDYNYYLTDYGLKDGTTPHTSLTVSLFYQIQQDNIALSDWVRRIIIDGERLSVGSGFLP
jgi:hypothetical protein